MRAMYYGVCARCDRGITPGQEIVRAPSALQAVERNAVIHAGCASGQDDQ